MRRGELWWANLPAPAGRRPVVLLSRDAAYATRSLIMIAPVTTRIRNIRAEVLIGREEGLTQESVANVDTIQTIDKRQLEKHIGGLGPPKIQQIDAAIHYSLGLPE